MALLLTDDSVFLHVPKAGGTWVTRVLREAGVVRFRFSSKHADVAHTLDFGRRHPWQYLKRTARGGPGLHGRIRAGYKFTFVRHPLSWYRSFYKYMTQLEWKRHTGIGRDPWHPYEELYDHKADSFEGFMERVVERSPGFCTRMFRGYTEPGVDFVGTQENLVSDLVHVMEARGFEFDPERVRQRKRENVSSKAKKPLALPADLFDAFAKTEAEGLERYGYDADPDAGRAQPAESATR